MTQENVPLSQPSSNSSTPLPSTLTCLHQPHLPPLSSFPLLPGYSFNSFCHNSVSLQTLHLLMNLLTLHLFPRIPNLFPFPPTSTTPIFIHITCWLLNNDFCSGIFEVSVLSDLALVTSYLPIIHPLSASKKTSSHILQYQFPVTILYHPLTHYLLFYTSPT